MLRYVITATVLFFATPAWAICPPQAPTLDASGQGGLLDACVDEVSPQGTPYPPGTQALVRATIRETGQVATATVPANGQVQPRVLDFGDPPETGTVDATAQVSGQEVGDVSSVSVRFLVPASGSPRPVLSAQ